MKLKYRIKIIILPLFLILAMLLCSCSERPHLDIYCSDLPDGLELKLLVQIDEDDENYKDNPKAGIIREEYSGGNAATRLDTDSYNSRTGGSAEDDSPDADEKYAALLRQADSVGEMHLYNYNEDGWRSADYYMNGGAATESSKFYLPGKYRRAGEFVSDYPNLRIAAVDVSGRVLKVSDTAYMLPDGKFAAYTALDYSFERNSLVPENPSYRSINGKTPDHYLIWFWLMLAAGDLAVIPLLVIMLAVRSGGKNHRHIAFMLIFALLSIGNIMFNANYLMLELVPAFDLESDGFTLSDMKLLLCINALWILEIIVFFAVRRKRSESNARLEQR